MNIRTGFTLWLGAVIGAAVGGCVGDPLQLRTELMPITVEGTLRPQLGETFQLRQGRVASLQNGNLLIAFHSVHQDSRCPRDATCIREGDAEIYIGTAKEGGPWSWSALHTAIEPMSREVDGFAVTVLGLDPVPTSTNSIPASAYAVSLRVKHP